MPTIASDVSLKSAHGVYLTAELDGSVGATRADYQTPGPWETWHWRPQPMPPDLPLESAELVCLQSHHGGWLCAEGGGGSTVTADRLYDTPGPWETFQAVRQGEGTYALRAHDGIHYVTAALDGHLECRATEIGPWEIWTVAPDPWREDATDGGAPGNRKPAGIVRLTDAGAGARICTDDHGAWLAVGASFFWVGRAWRDHRDRYIANMRWLADHGFTYYRGLVLCGGWPDPDPWRDAGAFLPWAVDELGQWLDDAYHTYGLRCSLTLFDGEVQTPTDGEQDAYVHAVCDVLLPRLHTLQDVQIANEYGPCGWDYPKGIERLKRHARTVRERLGPTIMLGLSSRNTAMGMVDDVYAECHKLFDGLLPDVVTVTVNHDDRDCTKIDGPWRHVRQGWERVVHDPNTGAQLEPDASIDDEPMGPRSSVAEETDASRIVGKILVDFISGRHAYTYHTDAGIWSDLLNPPQRGMGEHALIEDHPTSGDVARSLAALIPLLPPDLPTWTRTRHGIPDHPFDASFEQVGDVFTQIWPDGITDHGVVRAYAALDGGNRFVVALTGVKDRIDLAWVHPMEFEVYACGTGEQCQVIADQSGGGHLTLGDDVDSDYLLIGRYL